MLSPFSRFHVIKSMKKAEAEKIISLYGSALSLPKSCMKIWIWRIYHLSLGHKYKVIMENTARRIRRYRQQLEQSLSIQLSLQISSIFLSWGHWDAKGYVSLQNCSELRYHQAKIETEEIWAFPKSYAKSMAPQPRVIVLYKLERISCVPCPF